MGWWSKSPSPKDEPSTASAQSNPQNETLSRDEQELQQFLAAFEKSSNEADAKSNTSGSGAGSGSGSTQSSSPGPTGPTPSSIAPESLYPDTMSCRSAFDYAFFCQSFGGQFVNVYRYGELRSCSEHWENFWLCMRTRSYGDQEKARIMRDHYRKKAIKYKTGPSSEDVWDMRMAPVKNAFQGDFAALEKEMKEEEQGM